MSDLLQILRGLTSLHFCEYKIATISRRLVALRISTQEEYTQFCRTNPHALDSLLKDLLISVTWLFRDKDELNQLVDLLPRLVGAREGAPMRIRIAGCATEQEANSSAMLLAEALAAR